MTITTTTRTTTTTRPGAALAPFGPQRLSESAFDTVAYLLACNWPKEALPPETLRLYRALLAHLPDQIALRATIAACASRTFLPKPSEILQHAHELLAAAGQGPPTAEMAWYSVLSALKRGSTQPCHPLTRQALDALGGFHLVSQGTYAELGYLQRRFEAVYRKLLSRHYLSLAGLDQLPDHANTNGDASADHAETWDDAEGAPEYVPDPA